MFIQGLLFDIGDTLLCASELQMQAMQKVAAFASARGWVKDTGVFLTTYKAADSQPEFDEYADLNHLYSDARIFARTFEMLSWPFSPDQIALLLDTYRNYIRSHIQPDRQIRTVLERLRKKGFRLGVVSNGTTTEQLEQLDLLQISSYFDPILISERVGIRKPSPKIFLLAAIAWQLPPESILVVGDRADWDVLGAHHAGMKSALTTEFVNHTDSIQANAKPDLIIGTLSDLLHEVRIPHESESLRS